MRTMFLMAITLMTLFALGCNEADTSLAGPDVSTDRAPSPGSALDVTAPSNARGPVLNFAAPLSGDQEVPPVETRSTGLAKFQLRGDELSYHLNVSRTEGVTQSHIHCGAAGVNGPVVVFLFGFVPGGVTSNGRLADGTITAADVIPRADSAACPGGVADFDDLLEKMRSGDAYVNVHTLAHPAGEIRGQIDRGNGVR